MERKILPALGAFVVFTIDPIASLDLDLRTDAETIAACKELVNKKYVALAERDGLFKPWEAYNECTLEFVLRGEPRSSDDAFMEASMSIPIVPMTRDEHPSGRTPLKPSNPLPWTDCYISSFFCVTVRSPTLYTEEPIDCVLDLQELGRRSRFVGADVARSYDLEYQAKVARRKAAVKTAISESTARLNLDNPRSSSASSLNSTSHESGESDSDASSSISTEESADSDESDSIEEASEARSSGFPAPQRMITVTYSHNLSTVDEINPPEDYYKEVEALARSVIYVAQSSHN
ncbi:hypothetical protein C8R46DRAFT_925742 [Mycena filopes]|nr:hypothetical protein C8R46DRAFT_925742 [Mycena filopes]